MKDRYGRVIDYLRISITDRCNLRCVYCMPNGACAYVPKEEILSFEELLFLCESIVLLGIKHIKITGGEPLLREGVVPFLKELKQMEGIETVTLTTNGTLLSDMAEELSKTGIDGVNISLDTLNQEKFRCITRNGDLQQVLDGVHAMLQHKNVVVKLNCVLDGKDWEQDAVAVANLAKRYPLHVRFIELMPLGKSNTERRNEIEVKKLLETQFGTMRQCQEKIGFGPSIYYEIEGFCGKIGFISALSHKFCNQCNRIRLTCDGTLRMCLQKQDGIDIKPYVRTERSKEKLCEQIRYALAEKPREHQFECDCIQTESMSKIGG